MRSYRPTRGRLAIVLLTLIRTPFSVFRFRRAHALENLALRHQLDVLQRTAKKPRLRASDRALWFVPSRLWSGWRDSLIVVRPETVIRWHREGFRLQRRRKSRWKGSGRPRVPKEFRGLIRQMSEADALYVKPEDM